MASKPVEVAARDLKRGDILAKKRWSILAVDRPLSDSGIIRLTLLKPKSGRTFRRDLPANALVIIKRGGSA
jgi:hypothetical protein